MVAANGYAEDVLSRAAESGLLADPDAEFVAIDADRLASDTRWAAGRDGEALEFLHSARDRYDSVVDGRLREPARLSQAVAERLSEPLFGLYRDLADRLAATGEIDLALVSRRTLVDLLRGLTGALGEPAVRQLAAALADLADDLVDVDRVEEADTAAAEAAALVLGRTGADPFRSGGRGPGEAADPDRPPDGGHGTAGTGASRPTASRHVRRPGGRPAGPGGGRGAAGRDDGRRTGMHSRLWFERLAVGTRTRGEVHDLARGVLSRGEAERGPTPRAGPTPTSAWLGASAPRRTGWRSNGQEQARLEHERREAGPAGRRGKQERGQRRPGPRPLPPSGWRPNSGPPPRRPSEPRCKRRREERLEEHRREVEAGGGRGGGADLARAQEEWRRAKARR